MLAGMPADVGPLEKMNNEHERGRTLAIAMQDSLNRNRMDDFLAYSSRYIDLLKNHIAKEEDVLFAKAELILSGEEDEQIAADFDRFQSTIVGNQTRQRLCRTIDALSSKYLSEPQPSEIRSM
jgi:hemerythrin-like domain-containing protein